ncbi:hypothetical protein PR048_027125 [Dryococelus australis]|uniref:Uncharacterized protein n=1 Tax=Dryococelus australis TaxID=614101 RepID=A0ABQ9GGK1_9NEOP|nr:hypothetical protein PR048_027125 [Dryococelus australis]
MGVKRRDPRENPLTSRHRPARFPRAKIRERREPKPVSPRWRRLTDVESVVAELLDLSPLKPGSNPGRVTPDFRKWESWLTMPLAKEPETLKQLFSHLPGKPLPKQVSLRLAETVIQPDRRHRERERERETLQRPDSTPPEGLTSGRQGKDFLAGNPSERKCNPEGGMPNEVADKTNTDTSRGGRALGMRASLETFKWIADATRQTCRHLGWISLRLLFLFPCCRAGRGGAAGKLLTSHHWRNGFASRWARPMHFRMWESCRMMTLAGGFSRGSPVSPAFVVCLRRFTAGSYFS